MTDRYTSESAAEHRQKSPGKVGCAVITVSDTRTLENDKSGQAVVNSLESAGHTIVERAIVPDEPKKIHELVVRLVDSKDVEAILLTGGTGIAPRDQTPETLEKLITKNLPGYGELLRMLSYEEIGPAAMLSRALGGLIGQTLVLTMPGSTAAVRLTMEKLILPELGHLVTQGQGEQ
ncbi:MAG: MogA/MoaB family molybdenum cofactor biosynthesis protein [Planctomycetes bacterium]|nr:MogA/MoaB family molybdenum cofactor biosynthesis protein [Planctomycetota bacterium]